MIKLEDGKYNVYSESGKRFGSYNTEKEAKHRLALMEYFKGIKKHAAFKPDKLMIILRGLPGTGKSTLAKKLEKMIPNIKTFATDDLYMEKGVYKWTPEKRIPAHRLNRIRMIKALQSGNNVIADDIVSCQGFSFYVGKNIYCVLVFD